MLFEHYQQVISSSFLKLKRARISRIWHTFILHLSKVLSYPIDNSDHKLQWVWNVSGDRR